jgi:hypothetical protein
MGACRRQISLKPKIKMLPASPSLVSLKCQFITFSHAGISISNITSMPNISNFVLIFIIIFADQIPSVGLNCLTFTLYNSQVLPDLLKNTINKFGIKF